MSFLLLQLIASTKTTAGGEKFEMATNLAPLSMDLRMEFLAVLPALLIKLTRASKGMEQLASSADLEKVSWVQS